MAEESLAAGKRRNWLKTAWCALAGLVVGGIGGAFLGPWFLNWASIMLLGRPLSFNALTWAAPVGALFFGGWFAWLWGKDEGPSDWKPRAGR